MNDIGLLIVRVNPNERMRIIHEVKDFIFHKSVASYVRKRILAYLIDNKIKFFFLEFSFKLTKCSKKLNLKAEYHLKIYPSKIVIPLLAWHRQISLNIC